jgi:hypothetical protein
VPRASFPHSLEDNDPVAHTRSPGDFVAIPEGANAHIFGVASVSLMRFYRKRRNVLRTQAAP